MNREDRRLAEKKFISDKRKCINGKIADILSDAASVLGLPLEWVERRFVESLDKGNMLEDLKFIVKGIGSGEYEFDKTHNLIKAQ